MIDPIKQLVRYQTDKGLQEYYHTYMNYCFDDQTMKEVVKKMQTEILKEIKKRRSKKIETLLNDPTETRDNELHTDQ